MTPHISKTLYLNTWKFILGSLDSEIVLNLSGLETIKSIDTPPPSAHECSLPVLGSLR